MSLYQEAAIIASMEKRIVVAILVLGLLGWLGLIAIEWQFGLGRFASSPQEIVLAPGSRAIVGGGRAVLGFVAQKRNTVVVEVKCAAETRRVELAEAAPSEEVCGVRVRWSAAVDVFPRPSGGLRFEVSWESESDSD